MTEYFAARRAGNKLIRASKLDWTIIEPAKLGDGKRTGKIALGQDGIDNKVIARADEAATVVAALDAPSSIGKTFQIAGGGTPIPRRSPLLADFSRSLSIQTLAVRRCE